MGALPGCFGARNLVAMRATILTEEGARICPNVDGAAALQGVTSFTASLRIDQGQTDVQRDGDGNVCNTRTSADVVTGVDLAAELCVFDWEMIETLTGGTIAVNAGATHGWEYAKAADTPPHTIVDVWARTWDGAGPGNRQLRLHPSELLQHDLGTGPSVVPRKRPELPPHW